MLLKWKVKKQVVAECPDWTRDPYTGELTNQSGCTESHTQEIVEEHEKNFATKAELDAFKAAAPQSCSDFSNPTK